MPILPQASTIISLQNPQKGPEVLLASSKMSSVFLQYWFQLAVVAYSLSFYFFSNGKFKRNKQHDARKLCDAYFNFYFVTYYKKSLFSQEKRLVRNCHHPVME